MKNKFILIVLIVFMLVSCCSFTFASWDITLNDEIYKFPTEFSEHSYKAFFYWNGLDSSSGLYYRRGGLFSSDTPFYIAESSDNNFVVCSDSPYYFCSIDSSNNSPIDDIYDFSSYELTLNDSYNTYYKGYSQAIYVSSVSVTYYSSHDIYNVKDILFFQGAPLQEVELMKIRQVEEIPPMITLLVETVLIPILMIVGVLLIVYLVRYKIFSHL